MSRDSYYEVLGLQPHASAAELKNAYRDLAKVWHPDRFTHDPRLQRKAQEKLKEINEAYQELTSGGRPHRPPPTPPHASRRRRGPSDFPEVRIVRERRAASSLPALVLVAAVAGVALFAGSRLTKEPPAPVPAGSQTTAGAAAGDERAAESAPTGERRDKPNARQRGDEEAPAVGAAQQTEATSETAVAAPPRGLPTVNRNIDPATGLLATRACPLKLLRTFPAGEEPQQYCNADHTTKRAAEASAPQTERGGDKSRLKSALGTAVSPGKWFQKKEQKPAPRAEDPAGTP